MIIKCKMCGGDIEFTPGETYGTCAYCGSTSTIPKGLIFLRIICS